MDKNAVPIPRVSHRYDDGLLTIHRTDVCHDAGIENAQHRGVIGTGFFRQALYLSKRIYLRVIGASHLYKLKNFKCPREHRTKFLFDLVKLGLTDDERWRELNDRVATIIGSAIEATFK